MAKLLSPIKAVRFQCIECCGGSAKAVLWCSCDGLHSTRCEVWPYRLGVRPATVRAKHGPRLVTPELMPSANVPLDDLPGGVAEASRADIGHLLAG